MLCFISGFVQLNLMNIVFDLTSKIILINQYVYYQRFCKDVKQEFTEIICGILPI